MILDDLFSPKKLQEFGTDYVKVLILFLKKAHKSSTGSLINSVSYKLREEASQINIVIESEDYLTYVDQGRKPGKYPPIQAIANWCRVKGIPQSAAFPIAKNIFKFGIKPTNIIQQTVNVITNPTFIKKYEEEGAENIENIIKLEIEKINK